MKNIVVGILAHVDAGKTTLSEALLYHTEAIHTFGRVDLGTTFLDSNPIEKERGITIFSKQAVFSTPTANFTLLDTPGHIDFSTETERTLQVLDCAILVISGIDGVQSHTETLWKLLRTYQIPVFLFLNKMDISKIPKEQLLSQLQNRLHGNFLPFEFQNDAFHEAAAVCSETALQEYLETGEVSKETLRTAIAQRNLFPCCFGSALKQKGISEFLSILEAYAPHTEPKPEFGARVYKITEENGVRMTHLKLTGGILHAKDRLLTGLEKQEEKINQIRIYHGTRSQSANEVECGQICTVTGLQNTYPGEGLGIEADSQKPMLSPLLNYHVHVPKELDVHKVLEQLKKLEEQDPQLQVQWNSRLQEIHVRLMGEIQLEILRRRMQEQYQMPVTFDHGSIAYRETVKTTVEGVGHYEPLRHYAEVHLLIEPLPVGSGLQFAVNCREEVLDKNWQRLVLTHLQERTHMGILTCSPITDMRITLTTGKAHIKHTEGGDFRQATYRAIRQGLLSAENVLLEPWDSFVLTIPTSSVGRAMSDLQQMSAEFSAPEPISEEMSQITGSAPFSELRTYQPILTAYTKGVGRLQSQQKGYYPCHNAEEVIAMTNYDPENDPEFPGDSIFCSHGAGVLVKWNDVPERMHLPYSEQFRPKPLPTKTEQLRQQAAVYRNRLEEDKDLMQWFEKTYGKIQRKERWALETQRELPRESKPYKLPDLIQQEEYLLVDGYNVIYAWDRLKKYLPQDLPLARSLLADMLCNYQGFRQCHVILVFDAYMVKDGKEHIEKYHNIHIVYTKEAETADSYIERVSYELAKGKEKRVRVVTSDGSEQWIILGNGAYRVSAGEFEQEIKATEKAMEEFLQAGKPMTNQIKFS